MAAIFDCEHCPCHTCKQRLTTCGRCKDHHAVKNDPDALFNPVYGSCYWKDNNITRKVNK